LESLVAGVDGIKFSEAIEGDGPLVFAHACKLGLEGIVSKRLGGVYSSGHFPLRLPVGEIKRRIAPRACQQVAKGTLSLAYLV